MGPNSRVLEFNRISQKNSYFKKHARSKRVQIVELKAIRPTMV